MENKEISKQAEAAPLATQEEIITSLVLNGDLAKMTPVQKVEYYNSFCRSLQLNPLTQPFQILDLKGKLRMYATKDCTEQLRRINQVSVTDLEVKQVGDNYIVVSKGTDRTGRVDAATAVINIKGLQGEALANAMMKCETKSKRRLTLSLCGLGILDESEIESMDLNAKKESTHTDHHPAFVPDQEPEFMCNEETFDKLIGLLDSEHLGESFLSKKTKVANMKKAVTDLQAKNELTEEKAAEFVSFLEWEVAEIQKPEEERWRPEAPKA